MKSIRIGNDIRIKWPIVLSGDVEKLKELDLAVEVRPSRKIVDAHNFADRTYGRDKGKDKGRGRCPDFIRKETTVMMNGGIVCRPGTADGEERCRPCPPPKPAHPHRPLPPAPVMLPYHIEDNTLIAMWTADRQFATGDYDIILYAHKNEGGQAVCDQYRFVRLVSHTAQADAPDDSGIEAVIAMQPVTLELSGLSAYEVAVVNGFQGSEEEWLESLRKPAEDAAAKAEEAIGRIEAEVENVAEATKGINDYREHFVDTGINETMPENILTELSHITPDADSVALEFNRAHLGQPDGYRDETHGKTIPAATAESAGVMSAEDKKKLDSIEVSDCCCESLTFDDIDTATGTQGGGSIEITDCCCEPLTDEEVDSVTV